MSDLSPINNVLARNEQVRVAALAADPAPDGLAALSHLDNSALQPARASHQESVPLRPASPPEMALQLRNIATLAPPAAPEVQYAVDLTLPGTPGGSAHRAMRSDSCPFSPWLASALPFTATEALDTQPDAEISFLQKVASQMPHIADKIYLSTCELHKKSLQALLTGDTAISQQTAEHAWQFFSVEFSESKYRAFRHIINSSQRFSAADKAQLLRSLQRACINNGVCVRDNLIERPESAPVAFADLPPGSLSAGTIEMLAQFGATATELQEFKTRATQAALIRERMLDQGWHNAEMQVYEGMRDGVLSSQQGMPLINIMSDFRRYSSNLMLFIADDLASAGPDRDNPAISNHYGTAQGTQVLHQLCYNYFYAMPRLELFKAVVCHNLALLDNKLTPPQTLPLLRYRNNFPRLSKALDNIAEKRSACLLNNMPLLPFVFDIAGERPEGARAVAPYGDRGLPFRFFADLISDTSISLQRLAGIALYSTLEMIKISHSGDLPLGWMAPFSDATLARIFSPRPYPHERALHPDRRFICQLRALQAVKIIGGYLLPDYDHADLAKLLAWIKPGLKYPISDDDLAYCLFTDAPAFNLYLCDMATKINITRHPGNHLSYSTAEVAHDLLALCLDVTQAEARHLPSRTAQLSQQFIDRFTGEQALRLIAQRLNICLIQEDRSGQFQQWFDSEGNPHLQPPAAPQEAFVIRPGALTPLDHYGSQLPTIELEHNDNHSVLVAITDYRLESAWRRGERNLIGLDETVAQLEAEMLTLAEIHALPSQTKNRGEADGKTA